MALAERGLDAVARALAGGRASGAHIAILLQAEEIQPLHLSQRQVMGDERVEAHPVHQVVAGDHQGPRFTPVRAHVSTQCMGSAAACLAVCWNTVTCLENTAPRHRTSSRDQLDLAQENAINAGV
jgi:hypothetical protein